MKLGFVTNYSVKSIEFAKKVGFMSVQLLASPGSVLDADRVTDEDLARIEDNYRELRHHVWIPLPRFKHSILPPGMGPHV